MKKILLAAQKPFTADAVKEMMKIAEENGNELTVIENYETQKELMNAAAAADALIVRSDKVTPEVVASATDLKIVVRAGAGYDNIDLGACTRAGIVVMNTPGQNSNAVAELAVAMMIYMSRNQFTPAVGCEILSKRVGIQAFGNVGRLVGAKCAALGMKVSATDPFLADEAIKAAGATPVANLAELYSNSDFVSVHIPANEQTRKSIGYDLVASMPRGGCLINTARKEIIDEEGLLRALKERPDLKYATDVAPDNYEILRRECGLRVFATPKKMGAQTAEANVNAGIAAVRQICAFFATGDTRFRVN